MSDVEKKIALALVSTLVLAGLLLVVLVREPARMAASQEEFRLKDVEHGGELFAEDCAMCHGAEGQGLPRIGSVLNSKTLLTSVDDAALHDATRDGRPNSGMPAFGEDHGGPLNEHEISQLTAFMRN